MTLVLSALIMTIINWLKGWGPTDPPNDFNPQLWRLFASYLTSKGICAVYVSVLCYWLSNHLWQSIVAGMIYFTVQYIHSKRKIFVCNNGRIDALLLEKRFIGDWIAQLITGKPNVTWSSKQCKLYAILYGTIIGLFFGLTGFILNFYIIAIIPAMAYGLCYYVTVIAKEKYRESISRALFGMCLGLTIGLGL